MKLDRSITSEERLSDQSGAPAERMDVGDDRDGKKSVTELTCCGLCEANVA